MEAFTNRLAKETSPYLLQHAHNPVDWYPWGNEALEKAKQESKPILISIGYAACHWCHVMEKESFEDKETAELMNSNFINIKIDREERPDLDHIYMDAVQAMTGSGGWPLNVFLTPDAKPFYGGTYFPPRSFHNRPSWKDVLIGISASFRQKKDEIEMQAENLTDHLIQSNSFGKKKSGSEVFENVFDKKNLHQIYENIMKSADRIDGGFGTAPKFPQTFTIQFLLHYHYFTKSEDALKQACLSLDKMIQGGIYDQIGGGFSRYSTDSSWFAPHFEKMLYDNALLIIVLSEAYQITKNSLYKSIIEQTIEFIRREISSPESGFYASLDADSEGNEGKYYVWEKKEIDDILKEDSALFCAYYHVSEKGNWENKNILHIQENSGEFSKKRNIGEKEFLDMLKASKQKLLQERQKRIPPLLDNKIILGWNALMNIALCKASAALKNDDYKEIAIKNINFLLENFTNGVSRLPAFLDDYSFLISALIHLQEITSDSSYLLKAKEFAKHVISYFSDSETGHFFYTNKDQNDIIIRKKEIYDGAIPSGNSIMAFNFLYLSIYFDLAEWRERAIEAFSSLSKMVISYPTSFGGWATLFQALTYNIPEIVITGKEIKNLRKDFLHTFIPYKVFQSATRETDEFPLLVDKPINEKPQIYLCKNYTCQKPVSEIDELLEQLVKLAEN
jgi:uncharacterized protein YyaL (SSP411 family)